MKGGRARCQARGWGGPQRFSAKGSPTSSTGTRAEPDPSWARTVRRTGAEGRGGAEGVAGALLALGAVSGGSGATREATGGATPVAVATTTGAGSGASR